MFKEQQVNKVNSRKEFFRVPLNVIKQVIDKSGLGDSVHWTMKAEALEYRESVNLRIKEKEYLTKQNKKG